MREFTARRRPLTVVPSVQSHAIPRRGSRLARQTGVSGCEWWSCLGRFHDSLPDTAWATFSHSDRPWNHGVRGGRCRWQHDRGDADAEHAGRHLLRVERPRLPLQQPPALQRRERARPLPAARPVVVHERPDPVVQVDDRRHRFQKIGRKGEVRYGYAAATVVDEARGEVQGGAEPRRSHGAAGPGAVEQ